jgi:hypothetical protein
VVEVIDFYARKMTELDKETARLTLERRELFLKVIASVPHDVFAKIYFAAGPILTEWMAEREKNKP